LNIILNTARSIYELLPGDIIKINNSRSVHDIFFSKYLGCDIRFNKLVHIFVPRGEENDYKEEYDSCDECDVLYLDSLDQLLNFIVTEKDGTWFNEFLNLEKNSYTCLKYDKIIDIDNILLSRDNFTLPRLYSFGNLVNMPNDPLPAICVKEISQDLYAVLDGNHRIEYSKIKGYKYIPVIFI
jgi:hypothetical protein